MQTQISGPTNFSCTSKTLQPNLSVEISMPGYLLHDKWLLNGYYLQQISLHLTHWFIETCVCVQMIGDIVLHAKGKNMLKKKRKKFTLTKVVPLWIIYFMKQL